MSQRKAPRTQTTVRRNRLRRPLRLDSLEDRSVPARLFAVDGAGFSPSTLYELDPTNGSVIQTIGFTGEFHITDIDFDPTTGILYGVSNSPNQLLTIDINTGVATPIGPTDAQIPDISFRSDGTLFAWVEVDFATFTFFDDLATIDLTTGAVTYIPSPIDSFRTGLAFDSADNLYLKTDQLYQIDPSTADALSSIELVGGFPHNVLEFDGNDVLYTATRVGGGSNFQTIDRTTGVITTVGFTGGVGLTGLAFEAGLVVTSTDPADGSVVATTPTQYVVNVSDSLDGSTIQAGDFQVNGIAATGFTYVPGSESITFTFATDPVAGQGLQTMDIAENAFNSASDGDGVAEFNGSFRYDVLQLQVTSTSPANGSVVLLPFTTLDLNFNEAYDLASASPDDFVVNQGDVSSVSQVDADTLRLTLSGVVAEGTLTVDLTDGAMTDVYGNPGAAFSGSYTLDFGTFPYPTPLLAKNPGGSLIYGGSQAGIIDPAGDSDTFSILVDPGQKITVTVDPAGSLKPIVELYSGNALIGSATATSAGLEAVLQTVPGHGQLGVMGPGPKTYFVIVRRRAGQQARIRST